jgi:hypothetical protein
MSIFSKKKKKNVFRHTRIFFEILRNNGLKKKFQVEILI